MASLLKRVVPGFIVGPSPLRPFAWIFILPGLAAAQFGAKATTASQLEYNRDVRPILSENCFACHGADSAARKAGLRLDHFEDAIAPRKDSQPAITPGKPEASELIRRINAADDDIMPPVKTHKTLAPEQKETLKAWIAEGAKYQPHWSLIAPVRSGIPKVQNRRWARNPIDDFILARLEREGLKPTPEADKRTLARRVTLDLTGLPPAPEMVEAFVKDTSPNAYEKLVDRLLESPAYGEHRARYWLDVARYADSNGIHFDNYREMWAYREWVINAFNRNEPFDQFTIEQLAGDLLPNRTLDQQIASGFNRCNITSNEGGLIEDEYLVLYTRDRTETTSQVWLGLTAGCAVCHDHKFDPLSQKEFYSMSAFFNNTAQKAMDGNIKDTPPVIPVPPDAERPRWLALSAEMKQIGGRLDERRKTAQPAYAGWVTNSTAKTYYDKLPKDGLEFRAALNKRGKTNEAPFTEIMVRGETRKLTLATNTPWQDGVLAAKAYTTSDKDTPKVDDVGDFDKDQPFSFCAWVYLTKDREGAIVARMDDKKDYRGWDLWLEGGKPGTTIVSKWPDDAIKVVAKKPIEANKWAHVCITYDGSAKAAGVKIYLNGQLEKADYPTDKLKNSTRTTVPLTIGQRHTTARVEKAGIQDVRIYGRVLEPAEVAALTFDSRLAYLLGRPAEKRTEQMKKDLYETWLERLDPQFPKVMSEFRVCETERLEIEARGTEAHVMQERKDMAEAFVLFRGDYDKRRDKVQPITPAALPTMPADFPRNRLGFAKWLLLPENPLTARVTVNRFWQEIFGTGIVKTTGDFGVTGDMPSNPELLDWLAVDFRESGWDMKRLYRMFVTSAAYRQAATVTPDRLAKDPDNRLLSRGPHFRMDAEMVRDYALAASGLLVSKIGGPSVKPYQPDGVWEAVAMPGSNTRDYKRDAGESLYRRSLYTFWKRAAPPASMEIFNAPSRETCTVRRERTDTPLQALVTLNDPQFVEAARNLAQLTLEQGGKDQQDRLDFMARRLLARRLKPAERKVTESILNDLLAHYRSDPKDAEALVAVGESKADAALDKPTLAAYAMVANELLNLDEALNK
jgi:hypothetical protein